MRYVNVGTISFTDVNGNTRPAKDLREIPQDRIKSVIARMANEDFDLIATKQEAFGEGRESEAYRLFDANAVEIVEAGFDLSGISRVKVPVIE